MLWSIIAGLIVLWLIATVLKFTLGGIIHILLLIAVILLIYNFVKSRAT